MFHYYFINILGLKSAVRTFLFLSMTEQWQHEREWKRTKERQKWQIIISIAFMRSLCKSVFNIGIYRWMATAPQSHVRANAMRWEKSTVIHNLYVIIPNNSFAYVFHLEEFSFGKLFRITLVGLLTWPMTMVLSWYFYHFSVASKK